MSKTLSEILKNVNSFVDLEYDLPTGTELSTRVSFVNQAIDLAADTYQLNEFNRVYEVDPATLISVSLPTGFREFKVSPRQYVNSTWVEFPEILPEERYEKNPRDKYCYVLGNPQVGFTAVFNGHTADATLSFTYQAYPSGVATLSDVLELKDSTFVTVKTESYILQSRGDDRFPYVDQDANSKLQNLVGRGTKTPGGQYRVAPAGFRNPLS